MTFAYGLLISLRRKTASDYSASSTHRDSPLWSMWWKDKQVSRWAFRKN
ncbi:hypothetical protein V3C99_008521 [Haemonchus contortus]